jgi:hypothetical protein
MLLNTGVLELLPLFASKICPFLYIELNLLYMYGVELANGIFFKLPMSKTVACSKNTFRERHLNSD